MIKKIAIGVFWFIALLTMFLHLGLRLFGEPELAMVLMWIILIEGGIVLIR